MPTVVVSCNTGDGVVAAANVIVGHESGPFISLSVTDDLSIYMRGFGAESAKHAREVAEALLRAAGEVDALAAAPIHTEEV